MRKYRRLVPFLLMASLIFTTSCSGSSLSNASATCDLMTQILNDKKVVDAILFTLKDPKNINRLPKDERIKTINKLYKFFPFIEDIAKNSTLAAWPSNDLSKVFILKLFSKTEKNLFTEEELAKWDLIKDDMAKKDILDRIDQRLFGLEDPKSGPCGKDLGILFAGDLFSTLYGALDVASYFNICTPKNYCFDSLSPLQEICELFIDTGTRQADGVLSRGQAIERFLIVETRLKNDKFSNEDLKAISKEWGYGVYSRQQLALSVNKNAYGFNEENGYGQDKRLDALVSICTYYSPDQYLKRK